MAGYLVAVFRAALLAARPERARARAVQGLTRAARPAALHRRRPLHAARGGGRPVQLRAGDARRVRQCAEQWRGLLGRRGSLFGKTTLPCSMNSCNLLVP